MLHVDMKAIGRARERVREPLLTALTIIMAALMFVIVPFHAAGLIRTQTVGFGVLLIFIAGVVVLSGSLSAALAMGVALALGAAAAALRLTGPSTVDIYLDATAYIIVTCALALIVCRAVFGPGPVTYHRVIGAVLLYSDHCDVFVALYAFVGLLFHDAFRAYRCHDPTVTAKLICSALLTVHLDRIRRHRADRSHCPQPGQSRAAHHRPALSGDPAGAACHSRAQGRATLRRQNGGK